MSVELIKAEILRMAAEGLDEVCITVLRHGKVFGVSVDPAMWDDYKKLPFFDFARQYLEPAFNQLAQEEEVV